MCTVWQSKIKRLKQTRFFFNLEEIRNNRINITIQHTYFRKCELLSLCNNK